MVRLVERSAAEASALHASTQPRLLAPDTLNRLDASGASPASLRYGFTGHETFPFRYPWLAKGVRMAGDRPGIFGEEAATVLLGVGKNMVKSIRHWCLALRLCEPLPDRSGQVMPTPLGALLCGHEGWDPYLEDPGTLWLLHWLLVGNPERAATWHLLFTRWGGEPFTRELAVEWLGRIAAEQRSRATAESLRRDVDVFLRTYLPAGAARDLPPEDTFDCPLIELGLLQEPDRGTYQFARGPKPTLPEALFVYALHDYWQAVAPHQQTLSFEQLLHGPGSPGAAFKLSDNALALRLEALPPSAGLIFDETAGVRVLLRHGDADPADMLRLLERHYTPAGEVDDVECAG